jgi:FMN phosphatase YigB (HAD superfamily)
MSAKIPEEVVPLIKESMEREIALLESKIDLVQREISQLEKRHNLPSKKFEKKFDKGELGDEQDYFEWWGLLQGLKKLQEKVKLSKSVVSSC